MPVFLSFFPKNRHFEMGSNCDVLTLKRTSFSTFFVVGRSNHLPTTSAFFRQIPSVSIYTKKLEINLAAMPRGFESHRLRQRQHPTGRCFLFLRQTIQGLQGGIRTARARRFASRRAKMPRWGIFRARESPRFNGSMMGMRVEKRVVDPYSIRYYKTEGVFSACRLLFIGEIFSIAFYKELRLNKLEVSVAYLDFYIKPLFFASSINIG